MKVVVCCLFLCICILLIFKKQHIYSPFIPFETAMQRADSEFPKGLTRRKYKQWTLLKRLYTRALSRSPDSKARIPKTIHQIWLGGPLPEKYLNLQRSWQRQNPDWEYRLWTD